MKTIIILTLFMQFTQCWAQEGQKRATVINFEDEVVEGINRKPLDSVNQISERDGKNRPHLYRKRAGFSDLDTLLTEELRLQQ